MVKDYSNLFDTLQELTALSGVSGREQDVVRYLKDKLSSLSDDVLVDSHGNLAALRKGGSPGPTYMISVHSDEVGAVITAITDDGFLRAHPVGVVNCSIFPGTRLLVDRRIVGTVVCMPGHTSRHAGELQEQSKGFLIDVGAESAAQAAEWGIKLGDGVNFISPLTKMTRENLVLGKAIDNRVGCLILLELFKFLKDKTFPGTLYGVATVQEEIGMRGARMITNRLNPDFAIVIDTVPLDDTPLQSLPDVPIRLGGGPVLQTWIGKDDLFLGTVAHERVSELIQSSADELGLPLQPIAAYGKWVTDGAAIHTSLGGVPTSFLSIPRRYGHTPNEIVDLSDALAAIKILEHIVINKTQDFRTDFLKD